MPVFQEGKVNKSSVIGLVVYSKEVVCVCVLNSVCARINLNMSHTDVVAVLIYLLLVARTSVCMLFVFVVLLYVNLYGQTVIFVFWCYLLIRNSIPI